METYGLEDVSATVSITKQEYESLVRESERISIIKDWLNKYQCVTADDLKLILKMEEGGENA